MTRVWIVAAALLIATPAHARDGEALAFSKDGAQALLESSDHDREEGGSRTTYLIIGGGASVSAVLSDTMSRGSGPHQHQSPAECRHELETLRRALRGFAGVTLRAAGCNDPWRGNLMSVAAQAKAGTEQIPPGAPIGKSGLVASSDGTHVTLSRAGAGVVRIPVAIAPAQLTVSLSPTGRLLLLFSRGDQDAGLVAVAASPSGRAEELSLQK